MTQEVEIKGENGEPVKVLLKASASLPRLYRMRYNSDILADLQKLSKNFEEYADDEGNINEEDVDLSKINIDILENITFVMAKHATPDIPNDINEWLSQFSMYATLPVLKTVFELWNLNNLTSVKPKKNKGKRRAK